MVLHDFLPLVFMESARRKLSASFLRCTIVAVLGWMVGCSDSDQIRHYRAPKPASMPTTLANTQAHAPVAATGPQRMLAAIVPHSGQAWYFKVTGAPDDLEQHAEPFRQLLKSIRFDQGEPRWELPEGWQQKPGSGMRFATLILEEGDGAPELSVIPLPTSEGDQTQNILSNVNRWRNQIGLPEITEQALPESSETLELEGATATLVDLISEGGQAGPAASAAKAPAGPESPTAPTASGGTSIKFAAPEGWKPAPLVVSRGGITLRHEAAFDITSEGKRAEFTLDRLPAAMGLLQNVNRWRAQIGLDPVSDDQLNAAITKVEIDGVTSKMVELQGDQESILGIVAVRNGQAWYFKLKGDNEQVEREKDNFLAFARSVEFP